MHVCCIAIMLTHNKLHGTGACCRSGCLGVKYGVVVFVMIVGICHHHFRCGNGCAHSHRKQATLSYLNNCISCEWRSSTEHCSTLQRGHESDSKAATCMQRHSVFSHCTSHICVTCAALAVPVMTAVPLVTLIFGYFPIALNLPTVAAVTAYYTALHALMFYSRSMRELRALWLANIGTSIMFWVYAKGAFLTPFKQFVGRGLTFKTTSKGAHTFAERLVCMHADVHCVAIPQIACTKQSAALA